MRDIGEFSLIARLQAIIQRDDARVVVANGDDAAVVRYDRPVVMSTDAMVQGVHFREDWISYEATGYKAVVAALSDIGAMGGAPRHVMIALCVPQTARVEDLEALYRGVAEACHSYDVTVVGGDIVSTSGPLVVSVSVTGELLGDRAIQRSGAQIGDVLFVTGDLGGSGAYIDCMGSGSSPFIHAQDMYQLQLRHTRPIPQLTAGAILSQIDGVNSANDISDGLASELQEIAMASGVHIAVEGERIPTPPGVRHYARAVRRDPLEFALYGGEDYQLVGTVRKADAGKLLSVMQANGVRISVIGRVEEGDPGVDLLLEGKREPLHARGYDHFRRHEEREDSN